MYEICHREDLFKSMIYGPSQFNPMHIFSELIAIEFNASYTLANMCNSAALNSVLLHNVYSCND